jgi:hypothetical protein
MWQRTAWPCHHGRAKQPGASDTRGMTLEFVTRAVGLVIAVVGACVVSPAGFLLLVSDTKAFSKVRAARVRSWLSTRLPRLFSTQHVEVSAADSVNIGLSGEGVLTATGTVAATGTLEQRIKFLEDHLTLVNEELRKLHSTVEGNKQHAEQRLIAVRQELQQALDALAERVSGSERAAVRTDARALPVVALGAVLIALSPELGKSPLIAWPVMAIAVFITYRAAHAAWQDRKSS